jgi:hypothetical protein
MWDTHGKIYVSVIGGKGVVEDDADLAAILWLIGEVQLGMNL